MEDKIYIIHYDKLVERKEHIDKEILKHNFTNVEWILNKNQEDLTDSELSLFINTLSKGSKSLTMKHIETFTRIVKEDLDYALVFEDDVLLDNNFVNKYQLIKEQFLESDFEICFIGSGCGMKVKKIRENIEIYDSKHQTRCTDSYIIKKSLCKKLLDIYYEYPAYSVNIDFIMNKWFKDYKIKTCWSKSIVKQGSQHSVFKRSI
jgi:GR25 family glycosyltransferase involved in LPS biosynthesis